MQFQLLFRRLVRRFLVSAARFNSFRFGHLILDFITQLKRQAAFIYLLSCKPERSIFVFSFRFPETEIEEFAFKMNSFLLNSACNYPQATAPGPHSANPLFGYGLPDSYGQPLPPGVSAVSNASTHPVNSALMHSPHAYGGYSPNATVASQQHAMYSYHPSANPLATNPASLSPLVHPQQSHHNHGSVSMADLALDSASNCTGSSISTSSASATVAAVAAAAAAAAYEQLQTNYSPQLSTQSPSNGAISNNNSNAANNSNGHTMHGSSGHTIESDFYANTVRSMHNAAAVAAAAASSASQPNLPQSSSQLGNTLNSTPQSPNHNDQCAFHRHLYGNSQSTTDPIQQSLSAHHNAAPHHSHHHPAVAVHHSSTTLGHQGQSFSLTSLSNNVCPGISNEKSSPNDPRSTLPTASSALRTVSGADPLNSYPNQNSVIHSQSQPHSHHSQLLANMHFPNSHLHAMQQMNAPHSSPLAATSTPTSSSASSSSATTVNINNRHFNAQSPMMASSMSNPLSQLSGMAGNLTDSSSSHLSNPLGQMHSVMFQNGLAQTGSSFGPSSAQPSTTGSRCSSSNASSGNANSTNGNQIKMESPHSPNSSTNGSSNGLTNGLTSNGTSGPPFSLNRSQNSGNVINGQSNANTSNGGKPIIYAWMKKVQLNTGKGIATI